MRKYLIILFIAQQIFSQSLTILEEKKLFTEAVSISISQIGLIYVSDRGSNELLALDSAFNIIGSVGGFGTGEQNFDDPIDVYSTSLNVIVTDRNNKRVQVFDRKLNYIFAFMPSLQNSGLSEISYPTGCVISVAGDYFLLDGENNSVIKFDSRGKFLLKFGSYESGKFELSNPKKILTDGTNYIYLFENDRVVIFDLYGNGLMKFQIPLKVVSANVSNNFILVNSDSVINVYELNKFASPILTLNLEEEFGIDEISQAAILNNNLIVLTAEKIYKIKLQK